nr:hypothetical protein [Schaalia sp. JY-X159]
MDRDIVGAVSGEPVDFVDDAVGDFVFFDVADHALQSRTVCLLCRLARIHELLNDDRAQLCSLVLVRFTLRGDVEPFFLPSFFCSLLCGYPKIGHGECFAGHHGDSA